MSPRSSLSWSAVFLVVCAACGTADVPVLLLAADEDGGVDSTSIPDATSFPEDRSLHDAPSFPPDAPLFGTLAEYCAGRGPPLLIDEAGDAGPESTCPSLLAQRAFRYALCTCSGYVSTHGLFTDAFDSTQGTYDASAARVGGSVGDNGGLSPGVLQIGGSLWASNSMIGLTTSSPVEVKGELHAQAEVHAGPSLDVQASAWMASGIQTTGEVTVGGTLYVPMGAPIEIPQGMEHVAGPVDTTPFPVLPACDCALSHQVDVAGVVETYRAHNDDEALHIDPSMFDNVQSPLTTAQSTLPCGRIFLTQIGPSTVPIHLTAQGRVAVFVSGDLSTESDFIIDASPGNEVDLFVEKSVNVGGTFRVGDPSNPAGGRTYVGGTKVNLQGASEFAGNLYAPMADLLLGGSAPTTLFGSVFVGSFSATSDLTIHYDESILSLTPTCPGSTVCTTCNDCGGQPCNSGTCGMCTSSDQCCPPLVCGAGGVCGADIPS
jgi:hypothetical protein